MVEQNARKIAEVLDSPKWHTGLHPVEHISAKSIIWSSNKNTDELFILREGVVKLFTYFEEYKTLELLYPGAFFGGLVYMGIQDLKFEVFAAANVKVSRIKKCEVERLMQEDPQLTRECLAMLSGCIANLKRNTGEVVNLSLRARLVRCLKKDLEWRKAVHNNHPAVSKILRHEEWGFMLGARRESVSRVFSDLEKEGQLQVNDNFITFLKQDLA